MRALTLEETRAVVGGDDETGNELGCTVATSASVILAVEVSGGMVGSLVSVTAPVINQTCQTVTTSVGTTIGSGVAEGVEGVEESISGFYSFLSLYQMAESWMTGGL